MDERDRHTWHTFDPPWTDFTAWNLPAAQVKVVKKPLDDGRWRVEVIDLSPDTRFSDRYTEVRTVASEQRADEEAADFRAELGPESAAAHRTGTTAGDRGGR